MQYLTIFDKRVDGIILELKKMSFARIDIADVADAQS
jgi:hypothetical protein